MPADAGRGGDTRRTVPGGAGDDDGKTASSWRLQGKPKDRLSDVAGLAEVKD